MHGGPAQIWNSIKIIDRHDYTQSKKIVFQPSIRATIHPSLLSTDLRRKKAARLEAIVARAREAGYVIRRFPNMSSEIGRNESRGSCVGDAGIRSFIIMMVTARK